MFKAEPLTRSIGAEISEVSLNDFDAKTVEQIYQALIKYQVIFFRDQELSPESHMHLAESLG